MSIAATFIFCSCAKEKNKEYVEFYELGIMIQQKDLGNADWETADDMCRSSRVGGFNNWRLPTIGELATLSQNREILENIKDKPTEDTRYWSSSMCGHDGHPDSYKIYGFRGGSTDCLPARYGANVRAVRNME